MTKRLPQNVLTSSLKLEFKTILRGGFHEARGGNHTDGHSQARVCRCRGAVRRRGRCGGVGRPGHSLPECTHNDYMYTLHVRLTRLNTL